MKTTPDDLKGDLKGTSAALMVTKTVKEKAERRATIFQHVLRGNIKRQITVCYSFV